MHSYNPRTQEAEARISLHVRDQPRIQSEPKASLNHITRPCLKRTEKKKKKGNTKSFFYKMYSTLDKRLHWRMGVGPNTMYENTMPKTHYFIKQTLKH